MQRLSAAGPALAPNEDTVGQGQLADGTLQSSVSAPPPMPRPHQAAPTVANRAPSPVPAADATGAATLLADNVDLTGNNVLTASGGVVIWFQGARLLASSVVYDGNSGRLQIQGPIHLTRPASAGTPDETVIIADQADLDEDLTDGVVRGARLVLAREMQLAANELQRTGGGRMTTLTHVVASSCQVCAENPTPLWEIRARKITHDSETGKLSFDQPQFRAFGLPIATLPALTAPGPNVDRMTGFLRPEIRTTTGLGFGVKLPYFITLGDSADLTLTPYLAASRTTTLGVRYRQMFSNGVTEWNGAITRDDIRPDETRGYLFGGARFLLPRDYQLGLQVQMTSDPAYLLDYDVTDADRLWSGVTLERYNLDRMLRTRIGNYQTLRDDEDSSTTPALVADALSQRRFTPAWIGGTGWLEWSAHAHRRASPDDVVGRDVARASVALDWQRTQILSGGVVGAAQVRLDGDVYRIADDPNYDRTVGRATPAAGVELRWPLMAQSGGATHILEPMAQLVWSLPDHRANDDVPNEDSVLLEFDEGNLLSLNRAPGWDAREGGLRANVGVGWTRFDPAGWSLGVTAGRVYRADDDGGLGGPFAGRRSDWLLAAHYTGSHGLALSNRALFGDDLAINRNELRMGWLRPDLQVSAGYLWIDSDSEPGRDNDVSELTATTGWQVAEGWWANAETRYDFSEDRAQKAVLGMVYKNECVTVDLSVRRRFTSSDAVRPDTDFGLSVRLGGFGRQATSPGTVARRACLR
ncbi:MAG: LPS-assembly protein LptD [Paracoccus denitrificans]|nr:MAG: LPS-assembly protein LptD [Paracoccus denitrificans]PZO85336.1 MAG: LPS-assembly protein LptD [Paracoccus denitrificans]